MTRDGDKSDLSICSMYIIVKLDMNYTWTRYIKIFICIFQRPRTISEFEKKNCIFAVLKIQQVNIY